MYGEIKDNGQLTQVIFLCLTQFLKGFTKIKKQIRTNLLRKNSFCWDSFFRAEILATHLLNQYIFFYKSGHYCFITMVHRHIQQNSAHIMTNLNFSNQKKQMAAEFLEQLTFGYFRNYNQYREIIFRRPRQYGKTFENLI